MVPNSTPLSLLWMPQMVLLGGVTAVFGGSQAVVDCWCAL